ncbi:FliH/SctL family protein [Alkalicoccus luteus]|uniref:Flagellar assembly protein FliH/Type III secretion system HrpE domain-containing protein n=1 Tax=Alkalicoccus luteus TaxID=1237094 RepID=A0A969TVH1_9BACI|nr:FliH/SctL family protein [Alkalicoccus luteus]NJP36354.1 hypothetical protein [Alkalicoccus luteus]
MSSIIRKSDKTSSSVKIIRPLVMPAAEEAAAVLDTPAREDSKMVQQKMQDISMQQQELDKQKQEVEEWRIFQESELKEKSQQLYEQAEQQGFQAGYDSGTAQAELEWKQQISDAASIVKLAKSERIHQLEAVEDDAIKLAFHLAEKIIGRELEEKSLYHEMAKEALKTRSWTETVTVHASQTDYSLLCSQREELEEAAGPACELVLLPDPDMQAGDLVIETETSRFDAGADVQLKELKKKLFTNRGHKS